MFCQHCGKALDDQGKFCEYCGMPYPGDMHKAPEQSLDDCHPLNPIISSEGLDSPSLEDPKLSVNQLNKTTKVAHHPLLFKVLGLVLGIYLLLETIAIVRNVGLSFMPYFWKSLLLTLVGALLAMKIQQSGQILRWLGLLVYGLLTVTIGFSLFQKTRVVLEGRFFTMYVFVNYFLFDALAFGASVLLFKLTASKKD